MTSLADSLTERAVLPLSPDRFERFMHGEDAWRALTEANRHTRRAFEGRALWSISSRSHSGGLAALLASQTAYARGAGIDARWEVLGGSEDFFRLAKLLHNNLHGENGHLLEYSEDERRLYEGTLHGPASELAERLSPGDVVVLHDPQTAGMIGAVKEAGAYAIWRCHVGADRPSTRARRAWRFLEPYVKDADAYVFSRLQFVWESLDHARTHVILPSLNPLSPKNQELSAHQVAQILAAAAVQDGVVDAESLFVRVDGSPGRVDRHANLVEGSPLHPLDPVVLQVSPWNRLKDPSGVVDWFAREVAPRIDAHLVVAGPEPGDPEDEPEAPEVFEHTLDRWRAAPEELRARIHLVTIPVDDPEESSAVVNALQRRATVVVQNSRGEGFGMSVLEAMWKRRPVVCSRVGGLQEQVVDGVTGYLHDFADPKGAAESTLRLLRDPGLRERLGAAGRERVRRHFLLPREVVDWMRVFERVLGAGPA